MSSPATIGRLQRLATAARAVGVTIDGGGSDITTGLKGYVTCPFAGRITKWTLLGDAQGSIIIDVWKTSFAAAPPTGADSITGDHPPTLDSQQTAQGTSLADWTRTVSAGDVFGFNVDSASGVTRVTLAVSVVPT